MSESCPLILYIHGFNSSPLSRKARETQHWVVEHNLPVQVEVPALPYGPAASAAILQNLIENQPKGRAIGVIGSSLGGFYATWLAERYGLPAVLVNPAVRPYELLADCLGENENIYTGERYQLTEQHIQELLALDVAKPSEPRRLFLLVQTLDQTLDYRQATRKHAASRAWIEAGGNHEFSEFSRALPAIFSFFEETWRAVGPLDG